MIMESKRLNMVFLKTLISFKRPERWLYNYRPGTGHCAVDTVVGNCVVGLNSASYSVVHRCG